MSQPERLHTILAWFESRIVRLESIVIPSTDLTFEHGIGLFESVRAENGRVPLWPLHIQRLINSAEQLQIRLIDSNLPDINDLQRLVEESGFAQHSARLRLTVTGGTKSESCRVWVAAYPLDPVKADRLSLADDFWPVDERDPLTRFKSLNYWHRRRAFEEAQATGDDEKLSQDASGHLWEGSRTALLIVKNHQLISPPFDGPRLNSVACEALKTLGIPISFQKITTQMLAEADEVLLVNALRGVLSVGRWNDHHFASPGPVATSLRSKWQSTYF